MPVATNFGSAFRRAHQLRRLGESQTGIDDQLGRVDAGGHRGVDGDQQFVAHLCDYVTVGRDVMALPGPDERASASAPTAHRPRPRAGHVRSARPPLTSLTMVTPLSIAARARRPRAWCRC